MTRKSLIRRKKLKQNKTKQKTNQATNLNGFIWPINRLGEVILFIGVSTLVGYLMPNHISYIYIYMIEICGKLDKSNT